MPILNCKDNKIEIKEDHPLLQHPFLKTLDLNSTIPLSSSFIDFIFNFKTDNLNINECVEYLEMLVFEREQMRDYYLQLIKLDTNLIHNLFKYLSLNELHLIPEEHIRNYLDYIIDNDPDNKENAIIMKKYYNNRFLYLWFNQVSIFEI